MPCYIANTKSLKVTICGDLGPHCASCADVGLYLCDFPVGNGTACDRPMCETHSNEIAPEMHYCADHYKMWDDFVKNGGVKKALENVVPYKTESDK